MPSVLCIGVDPGCDLGLACVRRVDTPGRGRRYEVVEELTIKTDTKELWEVRLIDYAVAIDKWLHAAIPATQLFGISAVVEVPYRYSRRTGKLTAYTRGGRNVMGLIQLAMVTSRVMMVLAQAGVTVTTKPAPIGKSAKGWEKQKRKEAFLLTGHQPSSGHAAVAVMLAVSGL